MERPICFVDPEGGAFAAMAAAIARAGGHPEAIAATSGGEVRVPAEVPAVLEEIGAKLPEVRRLDEATARGAAELVDVALWGLSLHRGAGDLERLAAARIARDRIERRVGALDLG